MFVVDESGKNKKRILIVDDVALNRAFLRDMLEEYYTIMEASNGEEAIDLLQQYGTAIAVVLLDAIMPEMDGFEVLMIMNQKGWIDNIPVVMISAETSPEFVEKGYSLGATDYINRPFSAEIVMHRVHNTIVLYAKQNMLQSIVEEQIREREKNNTLMVDILSTVVEFRNGESGAHVRRIRVITEILLNALMRSYPQYDINESLIAVISNAAALHDIGKVMIPDDILNKPGKLTEEEFAIMKTHAEKGSDMLHAIHEGELEGLFLFAHNICRWHHERWDGRGYPDGLKGSEIPLCAQVVSLADVYDALVSERVYKPAYSKEKTLKMIANGECGVFNPDILNCLFNEAALLEEKIQLLSGDDRLFDVEKISREVISQKRATISDRTMALLEEERSKYQSFASLSDELLFEYEVANDTLIFSEAGAIALKLPIKIMNAQEWMKEEMVISLADFKNIYEKIKTSTVENPTFRQQCYAKLGYDQLTWIEITIKTLWTHEDHRKIYSLIGKIVDINDQKKEEQKLKFLAEVDPLTKLYNRRIMKTKIRELLNVHTMSAILYLDVDDFKNINDTLGHAEGDEVLKRIANCIKACIQGQDVAARLGGDEFLVYLYELNLEKLYARIHEFWVALQRKLLKDDLHMSMGVSIYPKDGTDLDLLISLADHALYESKRKGKNRYSLNSEI